MMASAHLEDFLSVFQLRCKYANQRYDVKEKRFFLIVECSDFIKFILK